MREVSRKLAGLAWLGALQFFANEAFAAAGYAGYSYGRGYISDLGAARCADICSPRHAAMNASFVLQGALILAGVAFSHGERSVLATMAKASLCISAVGVAVVGLAPEDVAPGWHYAGAAANLVCCNLGALGCGLAPGAGAAGRSGAVAGALGLAACAALGFHSLGGLGIGAVERMAAYPFVLWLAANGVETLFSRDGGGPLSRATEPRA